MNGSVGAQVCLTDGTWGACACAGGTTSEAQQLAALRAGIVGTWVGTQQNPWMRGAPCSTTISFFSDGHYSAHSPGDSCVVFYYGSNDDTPAKRYALDDVTAAGEGVGEIAFYFGPGNTNPGELKHVVLSDGGTRLAFEAWKTGYGPLIFTLQRAGLDGGTSSPESGSIVVDDGTPSTCPCTRRPGVGNGFQCPMGVGESTSMVVGPEGGKLVLDGQQRRRTGVPFSIEIPPTALASDTVITVTETGIAPPSQFVDYSPIYTIEPAALMTARPSPISIGWTNIDGKVGGSLAIYAAPSPSGVFARVPDSYTNAGFMQGSTHSFGAFFVGYPKKEAQLSCP